METKTWCHTILTLGLLFGVVFWRGFRRNPSRSAVPLELCFSIAAVLGEEDQSQLGEPDPCYTGDRKKDRGKWRSKLGGQKMRINNISFLPSGRESGQESLWQWGGGFQSDISMSVSIAVVQRLCGMAASALVALFRQFSSPACGRGVNLAMAVDLKPEGGIKTTPSAFIFFKNLVVFRSFESRLDI